MVTVVFTMVFLQKKTVQTLLTVVVIKVLLQML